jgi:hypothetical protein
MQHQLELWPDLQKPPQALDILEGLDQQERRTLIAALARLISKAVYPETLTNTQENNDEQ